MPVVELSLSRLEKLVGGKINKKKIMDTLPFLGLDIESEQDDQIRIEYSPNRPDYSTDFGIALGLQGLLGIKKGAINLAISKDKRATVHVDSSVSKIRPFVTAIIAKNGTIDDHVIKQLMAMQEDLHLGVGRRRIKSSIGIHDLDKINFPLYYTTTTREQKFIPLNESKPLTISEILTTTDVGKNYGGILGNSTKVPLILDVNGNVVSFPPIINAALTTVTTKTKNILVEVTGIEKVDVENMLSIVSVILQSAGFKLHNVKITGLKNSTPKFKSREISLNFNLVNDILGLKLSNSQILYCLKKARLDAVFKNKKIVCSVPQYRFDMLGPMDVVEEIALGYGIQNLTPTLSPSQTLGQKNKISESLKKISTTMIGLGYLEALNSTLTSKRILYDVTNRDSTEMISVLDSKSQEHTILRDSILPGLLENLSRNIHESYPQKLFESGIVILKNQGISEELHLSSLSAHKDANFSECKSVLQSCLKNCFEISFETKAISDPIFENGRGAKIVSGGKDLGLIGEINKNIIEHYKIRVPVVGFEIKLSGLIFD